jgi:pyrroloquinoline quinone biosynthesis protein E
MGDDPLYSRLAVDDAWSRDTLVQQHASVQTAATQGLANGGSRHVHQIGKKDMLSMTEGYFIHRPGELSRGAVLDVGLKCTHSCRFCYYSYMDDSNHQFSGIRKAKFRTLEQCKEILKRIKNNGFINFDYTGGEPTLHPQIVEITRYAHAELGLKGRIITLGQLLTRKKGGGCQTMLQDLLKAGLTNLLFSIHAADPDLFARITGESLARQQAAMDYLDNIGFDYTGNTTVFSWNYKHLPSLARHLVGHRIYLHNFIVMNAYYGWNRNGRAFGVQARYSDIYPYLKEAVDILESHGVGVNIRYAPLCILKGLEKNLVGVTGVRYDPYEWMNRGGHTGGSPELCAAPVNIKPGETDSAFQFRPVNTRLENGMRICGMRGTAKVFAEPCRACRAKEACDGIDPGYLDLHGLQEFSAYPASEKGPLLECRRSYLPAYVVKTEPLAPIKATVAELFKPPNGVPSKTHVDIGVTAASPDLVSIIVVNLNGGERIRRCINSVLAKTDIPYELIVVDNGSTDDSGHWLESLDVIHLIRNRNNVGAPVARNQALSIARGNWILFLDNDTIVSNNWLSRFLNHARNHPDVGMIGPRSDCVSGPQAVTGVQFSNEEELDRFADRWQASHHGQNRPIRRLILFCLFVRRHVVDKIGGIDPLFDKWGWEDDDYSVRAQLAGFKLLVADDIFIHHEGSYTSRSANLDYAQLHQQNWDLFKRKWNIWWYPGTASEETIDAFFSQPFDIKRDFVPLPPQDHLQIRRGRDSVQSRPKSASSADDTIASPLPIAKKLATAYVRKGQLLLRKRAPDQALQCFRQAMAHHPRLAEAYFGSALCCRLMDRHEAAVFHCQQALSCIGDFLGVNHWFKRYLDDNQDDLPYDALFCATVYATLALSHAALNRWQDALLCARAALDLDPDCQAASDIVRNGSALPGRQQASSAPAFSSGRVDPVQVPSLTLVMPTHYTNKLKVNRHLSLPGTGLVEATYRSLMNVFGDGIQRAAKIVCMDGFDPSSADKRAYRRNLEIFCRTHQFRLFCPPTSGLLQMVAAAAETIESDWILLVEHDWQFVGSPVDLDHLLCSLNRHEQVRYIRFNKRPNQIRRFDFLLEVEKEIDEVPLLRTTAHSNNPCLFRTRTFKRQWLPLCLQEPAFTSMDLANTAIGLEEPLFKHHRDDVRRLGFNKAHEKWGTYIYGGPGDPSRVKHLGV